MTELTSASKSPPTPTVGTPRGAPEGHSGGSAGISYAVLKGNTAAEIDASCYRNAAGLVGPMLNSALRLKFILVNLRETGQLPPGQTVDTLAGKVIKLPESAAAGSLAREYARAGKMGEVNIGNETGKIKRRHSQKNNPRPPSLLGGLQRRDPKGGDAPASRARAAQDRSPRVRLNALAPQRSKLLSAHVSQLIGPAFKSSGWFASDAPQYTLKNTLSSPQAAALDFAKSYNADSIILGREYGATIYEVKVAGETRYVYNLPQVGEVASVHPNAELPPRGGRPVATLHTHANSSHLSGGDRYFDERPSSDDMRLAGSTPLNDYVVTPEGKLLEYGSPHEEQYREVGDRMIPYDAGHYPDRVKREPNVLRHSDFYTQPRRPTKEPPK